MTSSLLTDGLTASLSTAGGTSRTLRSRVITLNSALTRSGQTTVILTGIRHTHVDMLQSIFLRTDYIRFAHGQHDAAFRENEKEGIINAAIQMVRDFDFDPETLQEGEE